MQKNHDLFYLFIFIFTKIVTNFLLKIWILSGAKVDKSIRSRKMLQNEYLVAKIGGDTAENEPLQILTLFIHLFIRVLTPQILAAAQAPRSRLKISHFLPKFEI